MDSKAMEFCGMEIQVAPDEQHEWLMSTADVARGYGVTDSTIRDHKKTHSDELIPGKHWFTVGNPDAENQTLKKTIWTKRGVIRLGMFIRSERAKIFRDWAEDLILERVEQPVPASPLAALEQTLSVLKDQESRLLALEKDRDDTHAKLDEIYTGGDLYQLLLEKVRQKGAALAVIFGQDQSVYIRKLWTEVKKFAGIPVFHHYKHIPLNRINDCLEFLDRVEIPAQLSLTN